MKTFLLWSMCCPMRVSFQVESAALVSTRIWQGFPFIFILASSWLFKGLLVIVYWRIPQNPWTLGGVVLGLPFESRYGTFKLMMKNLHKVFEDNSFPSVPDDYNWDTNFWANVLIMDSWGCNAGGPGIILSLWPWSSYSCEANSMDDFCSGSCSRVLSKCSAIH